MLDQCEACARCGAEAFDAIDLCEDCLALVTLGEILRGDHGPQERAELRGAIADNYWTDGPLGALRRIRRLLAIRRQWGGS